MDFSPFNTGHINQELGTDDGPQFDFTNIGTINSNPTTTGGFSTTTGAGAGVYARVYALLASYAAPPTLPTYTVSYGNNIGTNSMWTFESGVVPFHVKAATQFEGTVEFNAAINTTATGLATFAGTAEFQETATFSKALGNALYA